MQMAQCLGKNIHIRCYFCMLDLLSTLGSDWTTGVLLSILSVQIQIFSEYRVKMRSW